MLSGRDDEGDQKAVDSLRDNASDATETAERLVGYLEDFLRDQPKDRPPQVAFDYFVGRLSRGLLPSTLKTYCEALRSYDIFPGRLEAARERIRRVRLINGIQRRDAEREIADRRSPPGLADLRRIVEESCPGDEERDMEYRTLFYVQIATGGRPENLLQIHDLQLEAGTLLVKWGRRKIRAGGRARLGYPHSWSFAPPEEVAARIKRFPAEPWIFKSRNIASAMGNWLKRRCERLGIQGHITATVGRPLMSAILYRLYEDGVMSREKFNDLMDHEPEMSRLRYQDTLV